MSAKGKKYTPIVKPTIGVYILKTLINQAFEASSIATATATVIPTIGLLPVATAFIYRRLVSSTDISVELFCVIYRMVKHDERLIIIS